MSDLFSLLARLLCNLYFRKRPQFTGSRRTLDIAIGPPPLLSKTLFLCLGLEQHRANQQHLRLPRPLDVLRLRLSAHVVPFLFYDPFLFSLRGFFFFIQLESGRGTGDNCLPPPRSWQPPPSDPHAPIVVSSLFDSVFIFFLFVSG